VRDCGVANPGIGVTAIRNQMTGNRKCRAWRPAREVKFWRGFSGGRDRGRPSRQARHFLFPVI